MEEGDTPIFGIDLGTTYSCIAYVDADQQPVVIANAEGERLTPSIVQFEPEGRIVGREAREAAAEVPEDVVCMVKRQIGVPNWRFEYGGQQYSAEEISSYILRKLARDAYQQTGQRVVDVVITCPAYFGISQREATARAGLIAGLNVWEVINEPSAAAIAYGLRQQERDQVVLVFDLGGGTFDVTVIALQQGSIREIATYGDQTCGGKDWDEAVVSYLVRQWQQITGSQEDILEDASTAQDLWSRAEMAKRFLSRRQEISVSVVSGGRQAEIPLSRQTFDTITASLLDRTLLFTREVVAQASQRGCPHLDQILLVGGSTHMPQVKARLEAEFHLPVTRYDPDEVVAKGAAIYAQKLKLDRQVQARLAAQQDAQSQLCATGTLPQEIAAAQSAVAREKGWNLENVRELNNLTITHVASRSFGILAKAQTGPDDYRDVISNLVLINEPLPRSANRQYFLLHSQQPAVEIKIIENMLAQPLVDDPGMGEVIGTMLLPLPPDARTGMPIEVAFALNSQGRLQVVGREPGTQTLIEATFATSAGPGQQELQEALSRQQTLFIL